jgi:putative sterol carrier protein
MPDPSVKENRAQLAKMIEGRSDEEILKEVQAQGIDTALGNVFQGMAAAFLPEKAANKTAIIQYDVTTPEGTHSYQLKIGEGKCEAGRGADNPPKVTLTLSVPDLLRIVSGKANGQQLFMSGKLKLKGDMAIAMAMQTWFDQS